jgi:hypothetical protein
VVFKVNNAPSGDYSVDVTDLTNEDLNWNGETPPNSFTK